MNLSIVIGYKSAPAINKAKSKIGFTGPGLTPQQDALPLNLNRTGVTADHGFDPMPDFPILATLLGT
jgi:hypothetical protein